MPTKRVSLFPTGALSLAAVVSLLAACAPAKRIQFADIGITPPGPTLTIKKDIDMVRLEGVLNTPEQVERVVQRASALFDQSMVINDIVVDPAVSEAGWLDPVLATVQGISHISDFSVIAADGQMLVGGSVGTAIGATTIESMASDLAGENLAVTSNLIVSNAGQDIVYDHSEGVPVSNASQDYQAIDLLKEIALNNKEILLNNEVEGEVLEVSPMLLVEQPAVAVAEPVVVEVASAVRVVPEPVVLPQDDVATSIASNDADADTDADGVPDINDQCVTRPGSPVDAAGCKLLDGFLNHVQFTDKPSALATGSEQELDEIADLMESYPDTRIAVISYARGESDIQRAMARQRAFLVTSYLEGQGVEKNRVQTFALSHQAGVGEKIMIKEID